MRLARKTEWLLFRSLRLCDRRDESLGPFVTSPALKQLRQMTKLIEQEAGELVTKGHSALQTLHVSHVSRGNFVRDLHRLSALRTLRVQTSRSTETEVVKMICSPPQRLARIEIAVTAASWGLAASLPAKADVLVLFEGMNHGDDFEAESRREKSMRLALSGSSSYTQVEVRLGAKHERGLGNQLQTLRDRFPLANFDVSIQSARPLSEGERTVVEQTLKPLCRTFAWV